MTRIQDLWEKNRRKLWFSFLLNALLLLFFVLVFRPAYETNDDYVLNAIACGAYGAPDGHLVFISYPLGLLLAGLYSLTNAIPWYPIMLYAVTFFSLSFMTYIFLNRFSQVSTQWICAILIIWLSYESYVLPQYTKLAGIVTCAGLLLIFYAAGLKKTNVWLLGSGVLLALVGAMLRISEFAAVTVILTALTLAFVRRAIHDCDKQERRQRLTRYGVSFLCLIALVVGAKVVDAKAYSSADWQAFDRWGTGRDMLDYGFPDYAANEAAYQALGIDETALTLYQRWSYYDTEKFSADITEQVQALKESPKITFLSFLKTCCFILYCFPTRIKLSFLFLAIFLLWIIRTKKGAKDILLMAYALALTGIFYLYLYYAGRVFVHRVDIGVWAALCAFGLCMLPENKKLLPAGLSCVLLLAAVVYIGTLSYPNLRVNRAQERAAAIDEQATIAELNADQEHIYFFKVYTVLEPPYWAFDTIPVGSASNFVWLGGWMSEMPSVKEILNRYQITNPYRDMVGNPQAYLVDDDIDLTLTYLRTWYNPNASATQAGDYMQYPMYQIDIEPE